MSLSAAERTSIVGAILLAGGIVAATLLFLLSGGRRTGEPEPAPEEASAAAPAVSPDAASLPVPPASGAGEGAGAAVAEEDPAPRTDAGLRRENDRLRGEIERRDDRIRELEGRLRDAGIPVEEEPEKPEIVAARVLDRLKECGPETPPGAIDGYVDELVQTGEGGIGVVKRFLEQDFDLGFADSWRVVGARFGTYPTLRIALFDALRQAGGVEGQAALAGLLRASEKPLETVVLLWLLADVRRVPSVDEAKLAAARRYLDGEPARREIYFVGPLLDALALDEPAAAAKDYVRFATRPDRDFETARRALDAISALPPEVAIPALAKLATSPEPAAIATRAAETLAARDEPAAVPALAEVLSTAAPAVRSATGRALVDSLEDRARDLGRIGAGEGLEALTRFEALERDLAARKDLIEARAGTEKDPDVVEELDRVRRRLSEVEATVAALGKRLRGK